MQNKQWTYSISIFENFRILSSKRAPQHSSSRTDSFLNARIERLSYKYLYSSYNVLQMYFNNSVFCVELIIEVFEVIFYMEQINVTCILYTYLHSSFNSKFVNVLIWHNTVECIT